MNTAIIGGGIGGMITALYLNLKGEEVSIYEKENRLGGRLSYTGQDGFKVDEGPTIVLLPHMIREILKEVQFDMSKIDMVRIDPIYPLHFRDGTTFMKWSDPDKQKQEIDNHFPGESVHYAAYMKDMAHRFEKGKEAFLDRAFVSKRSFWSRKNVNTLMKLKAYQTVKNQTRKYFQAKQLQEAFSLQTLYIGGSPEQTPAIYSLVPFSEHEHGIWYIKGGYAYLAQLLTEELANRGVHIKYGAEVEDIQVEKNRATSLTVHSKQIYYDRFILNGDFPVAEKLVNKKTSRSYTPSAGCLLIYLGIEGQLNTKHVHQFFMGRNLDKQMEEIFTQKKLPEDPSFYLFHPSIIDDTLAPVGKSVAYILIPVPTSSDITREEFEAYANKMIKELKARLDPDIEDKILWKQIRTPKEAKRDGLFEGGSFGLAPTLFQSGVFRPQVKPFAYDNIYAVGASIHPGGGVPIVMQGAKVLSEYLDEEEQFLNRAKTNSSQ
ncbi:phytoene desaturase [Salipaludibacillus keqinensis]|uniref:Phytoene desaturase n=1 Tax=Salipaludibacillus keqinensis TaxID=2045207 RepID=A0A323TNX6_9BACI|nr:phytoene desaturase family protein [Salipaludibacillus keqinensis]PYZ94413.1 phytoene desaturase [Salipaludibacillus keqinensis]